MAARLKLLVVDDSTPNRMILADSFKRDYEILMASNGQEALDVLEDNPDTSVVIMDLLMPEMDGFTALKRIMRNERLNHIPILAVTSSDSTDDQILALDLGAFDVLKKPINIKLAAHKIKNIVARSEVFKENPSAEVIKKITDANVIDEKTGIYNKRTFCIRAAELMALNPNDKYVILRVDIDGFKVLNDVYGIDEGDRILRSYASELIGYSFDGMIYGRWEADHFVMCMSLDNYNRMHIADKALSNAMQNSEFSISLRMGVFVVDDTSIDVSLMCDRALLALKSIKNNFTKKIAFYDDAMRIELIERQQVINEMKSALDSGQFVIYLQPQINYADGTLHGAEALVRWKHPEKGIIPPIKFIPVFEQNGFITHLDQFVWEEVCRLQRKWLDSGMEIVPISVNVSRTDICSLRLAEYFRKLIDRYNLEPSAIRIEITESAYMDTPAQLVNAVERLREVGFKVEMDDFGSGYSSLNTLKDVPVDMLKLDMKFLDSTGRDSRGGNILSSVVRMSNWLKLPVLAEGVETKNQADYLKSIGCVYMQGYYFAKPMPVSDFEGILVKENHEKGVAIKFEEDINKATEFLNASTQSTLLFNSFVGGAAIIEYDGTNVEAVRINDKFFEVVGCSRDDYAHYVNDMLSLFNEENKNRFRRTLEHAIKTRQEADCEMCTSWLHPGQDIWTKARVRLLASNVNRYLFYLTIENISQKMNLLTSNLRLTDQLTTIINNVPGGIIDYQLKSESEISIIYFNDKLPQMFGFTREEYQKEFSNKPLRSVYPDDIEDVAKATRDLYEGTSSNVTIRYRHVCKDGSWKWIEFNGGCTRRQDNTLFATATITNLNDQIIAEEVATNREREIVRQQKFMKSLYENVPCGIMVYLHNAGKKILSNYNSFAWNLLGYDSEVRFYNDVFLGEGMISVHHEDAESFHQAEDRVVNGDMDANEVVRHRILRPDGSVLNVNTLIQKIIMDNDVEYLQYVFYETGKPL